MTFDKSADKSVRRRRGRARQVIFDRGGKREVSGSGRARLPGRLNSLAYSIGDMPAN